MIKNLCHIKLVRLWIYKRVLSRIKSNKDHFICLALISIFPFLEITYLKEIMELQPKDRRAKWFDSKEERVKALEEIIEKMK